MWNPQFGTKELRIAQKPQTMDTQQGLSQKFETVGATQRLNRKGLSDKRSAVGFCLGRGLFGSYNSD